MAQKRDKEETELKVPETLICAAPISAPPKLSAAVEDQISKTEISDLAPDQMILMASVTEGHRSRSARSPERPDLASASGGSTSASASPSPPPRQPQAADARRSVNRCAGCKRKVGLTGFRCRCGEMFCSVHRYSDRHDCSFDYKAAGREAIARENPVVRAAKILKV